MRAAPVTCLCLSFLLGGWLAVAAAAPPIATPGLLRVAHYGVEDGLSQATGRVMRQDTEGYVWIGTQDGLNRFDGYEFRVYRSEPRNPDSLPDNHVLALEIAGDSLWVGTQSGGLARYVAAEDRFQRYSADGRAGSLANAQVTALRADRRSRLWVATGRGELQVLDLGDTDARFHRVALPPEIGPIRSLLPNGDGMLVGSNNGVWELPAAGQAVSHWRAAGLEHVAIEAMAWSPDQRELWVATTDAGVFRLGRDGQLLRRWRRADGLADDGTRDLLFDRAGRLWVSTIDGLSRLERGGEAWTSWRYEASGNEGLASGRLQALMEDRDGLIWIGTWINGINQFSPRTEAFLQLRANPADPRALPGFAVPGVHIEDDGTLWLGVLEGGGLVHYDLQHGVLARYVHDGDDPRSLPSNIVQHALRDRRGRLWVATAGGLALLRGDGRFDVFRHDPNDPQSLPGNYLRRLYLDRRGTLWIGGESGLASLCDGCSGFTRHRLSADEGPAGPGIDSVSAIFEDSRGDFWVGLRPGGLVLFDRDSGRTTRFRGQPDVVGALGHDTVSTLFEDRNGTLWVGSQGGGVARMRRAPDGQIRFQTYSSAEGLAANAIGGILEDGRGHIWVSTTVGLSRIEPTSGRIHNYSGRDGTQTEGYFIGGHGQLLDGRMVFGGLRGLTIFDPESVPAPAAPNRVHLTRIQVDGEIRSGAAYRLDVQAGEQQILLGEGRDDLRLEFSALSYGDPNSLRYAYRMDGVDPDWTEVDGRRRIAVYSNLAPGEYVWRVQARNLGGEWGEGYLVRVHVPGPWWRSGPAIGASLLLLGLGGAALLLFLRRRWRERERAREALALSEERLKLALWGTGDEMWELDLVNDRLHRQNPLQHLEGAGQAEVEHATSLRKYIHPDDVAGFDEAMKANIVGKSGHIEVSYRVKDHDGSWRWLLTRGRVVDRDAQGRPLRLAGTSSDITRLKQHEEELAAVNLELESRVQRRTEALREANLQLQETVDALQRTQRQLVDAEKLAALGGLVAGVAHEINTPLGIGVTAASHLEQATRQLQKQIETGQLTREALVAFADTALESSQLVMRNLQRADRLVKSFKQVAVDQSSEQRRVFNLRQYLDEILVSLHPALKKTRHHVDVDCPADIVMDSFPGAIYQIVVNLVMNSLIHGFESQPEGRIRIVARRDDDRLVLDYGDDGCGMDEESRRKVFDPFYTTRRGQGGSGLGMHIAWNLARQVLGGKLIVEHADRGVHFRLLVPLRPEVRGG
jgi:PAS domain S-box-containing protein